MITKKQQKKELKQSGTIVSQNFWPSESVEGRPGVFGMMMRLFKKFEIFSILSY